MKLLVIISLMTTILTIQAKEKFEFSSMKDNQGYACSNARGESRRQLSAICDKKKMKVDWDNIEISKCKTKQLKANKFKATYIYKYECIEK